MNYAKAFEEEYARLIHAGPRPKPKGPKYYGLKKQIIGVMLDGRAYTAGDIVYRIGCPARVASFWLGRLRGDGDLEVEHRHGLNLYWLAGSQQIDTTPKPM
jgi:hypothetical protein